MSADQFLALAGCLFGAHGDDAAPPEAAPPAPAAQTAPLPAAVALPEVKFGVAPADPGTPHRPLELYAAAAASSVRFESGQTSQWRSATGGLVVPVQARAALTFEAQHESRSALSDTRLSAQLDTPLGRHASGWFQLSATPHAQFKEQWGLAGAVDWSASRSVGLGLAARSAVYGTGRFTTLAPTARFNPHGLALELSGKWIHLWDAAGQHYSGWSLNAAYDLGPAKRLIAGLANYPDPEAGQLRRVKSAYASVVWPLTARLNLRLTAARDVREHSYRATGITLGLSWRLGPRYDAQ